VSGRVLVGVTSWADRSLLASGWYPKGMRSPAARLRFYASQFPIVENDMAYYALPERAQVEAWAQRTPPSFTMNVKAHALLTGHYTDPRRLPAELRSRLPRALVARERIYPRDLHPAILDEIAARLHDALVPLHERGKLGVVLFQFPVWFPISRDNRRELILIKRRFLPYRVAVEFRNATWMSPRNRDETLELLEASGLSYTCVDEPQGFPSSVPPLVAATSELALVRLHGRNRVRWDRKARSAGERFAYLYSPEELRQWVPAVSHLARTASEVHVLFNNCHRDYAVRNARQMVQILDEAGVHAPVGSPLSP
jgi:uncharacterized protein YecE (DUF72 family)